MEQLEKLSKPEKFNLALALAALLLSLAAIVLFVILRNTLILYMLLIAVAVGFYFIYFVSRTESVPQKESALQKKRKGRN